MIGDNCSSSCPTKDHETFGECLRSKNLKVAYCQSASGKDATDQKKWDAELDRYKAASEQGIQPDGTSMKQVIAAEKKSQKHGVAYGTDAYRTNQVKKLSEKYA